MKSSSDAVVFFDNVLDTLLVLTYLVITLFTDRNEDEVTKLLSQET